MSDHVIDHIIDDLKRDEGFVPHAYKDHLGYLTIGYGFLIDKRKGGKIPQQVAEFWLEYLVDHRIDELLERIPWMEYQPDDVQRALVNMAYQLGTNGLLKFKGMLEALKNGDRAKAAEEALDSLWASQTPQRAKRMADLIRGWKLPEHAE